LTQRQALWFKVDGKPDIVGYRLLYIDACTRTVQGVPSHALNAYDVAFRILRQTIQDWGYSIDIFNGGVVKVYLPKGDQYGKVCREIARCYWLCMHSPNPRSEPKEAVA